MQNAPTVETQLKKLLERIDSEQLILPEIQRDFVWTKKSVKYLFDSLFRGLPIGHMLVWKAKKAVPIKHFHGKKLKAGVLLDNFYGYLLDGQQRLTALDRVRDADDDYLLMFCTWPDREKDGYDTFVWQKDWNKSSPWYVSVAEILGNRFDRLRYLRDIKKDKEYEASFEKRIDEDLGKLQRLLDYSVGVIEFETDDYGVATELFIRFNSTGRKLSKSDLFLAELAVKVEGLATNEIQRVAQKWPNFGFTMPFLAQCLLAVCTKRLILLCYASNRFFC